MEVNYILNLIATIILFLAILCRISSKAKCAMKYVAYLIFLIINSSLTSLYGIIHYKDRYKTALFAGSMCPLISKILGIDWEVIKDEDVPKNRSFVVLCNHQSAVDMLGMMKVWPHLGPTFAIAKSQLKYFGILGLSLDRCGTIFVDRQSEKGKKTINEAGAEAKKKGINIFLFPEGTRNRKRDGSMLPFKKGAFHIALDVGMPILPVVISEYNFINSEKRLFEHGKAKIKILKPIETEGYTKDTMDELIKLTRDTMVKEFQSLSNYNKKTQ